MTERNEFPRTLSTAIPAIPIPAPSTEPVTATEEEARSRIATLEREARAIGNQPASALLFHEMGLLWESPLKHARNAAVAYQSAFKLAPRFLANIRAARRLFSEVGNWQMVSQLLDAELQATEGKRARAALLFEKSQILEQRLSREVDASAALAACLALEPEDVTLLVQLEQVFTEKADYPSVVRVNQLLAQTVTDDAARAHYLTTAGLLLEDRLKDLPAAAQTFRQAFAVDRRDPQLLSAMKRVAQREGTVDEELAALAAEAEGQGPGAAPTFLQIAKAYERLERPEDALAALLAARRVSPNEPLVLAELARIYEARGRNEELADVLLAWVSTNNDQSEFVAINLRLAALFEELKREPEAIARYRAILERVPGHAGSLAGLGKLSYRLQNWTGLVETYDAEAAASDDPRTRAGRLYKAGETLEERLGQIDDALARYTQALTFAPGFLPATKALTRLYEKLGKWNELVSMHEQELLQLRDKEQQISTLNTIAILYEDRLSDVPHAVECLRRVLEISPDHLPTMRNLARLHERAQQWQELLALNEQEGRLATDQKQVISLAHRNAEILEENVKDRPAAIAAWERVLQLSPNYLPALRSLGRLYGQDGRWDSLIAMYRAEAEMAPSTDQAATLIQKIGELYEQKLTDQNQAISSYREVLTLAPSHFPALRALARIYRAQGAWENLIEILRAEAANRTDPTERANAMFQAAAIWEDQLKKPQNALEGYQEVLRLAPNHVTALQQLERILTASDDVKELIVLLDRQVQGGAPQVKVGASLKLARLYLDRLNETARAAASCETALSIEPQNLSALRLLERIKANDKVKRTELRARIAEVLGDEKLSAAMRLSSMDGAAGGTPDALVLDQLKRAYSQDPTDESLGLTLERALQKASDAAGLVELYERRRTTTTDSADMLALSLRIADLYETRLNDLPKARHAYETALQSAPDLYPALRGLTRCLLRSGGPADAVKVLDQLASTARDQATMQEALMDAARIARDTLKDDTAAASYYGKVLDRDPLHPEAGPALEELLARRGGAVDLAALHEKRGEAKLAQKDLFNAAQEFYKGARIWLDGVKNRDKAMAALDRSLMAMPTLPDALELKATLAIEAQSYAEAAAALAVRVQQGGDPLTLARVHLRLGALYHDHLSDQTRAAAHLQTALAADASSTEALERLSTIHTASRNWTGAADCLRRLLELDNAITARARHTTMLARITDEGFGDVGQAITLYRKALELAPGDAATLDRLVALYERTGAMTELVTMLEQQVQQASDVKRAVALKMRIGAIQAKQLDDPQRAIATFRQVTEIDPTFVDAHVALAEAFSRDTASISMAIETHRTLLKLEPARIESLRALFRMWESLKQLDKAFCAAGILVFLKAANEVEQAFYSEGRNRLPSDFRSSLGPPELMMVHHPTTRNALVDVVRAIGDQFAKLNPPNLEGQGIDRRADRLKTDHAVVKAMSSVLQLFGGAEFEPYQARKGLVYLETGEPLAVLVGPDVVRRFNIREQRFLFGRAALGLIDKAALVRKLSMGEFADVLGNSVRIHQPTWGGLGRKNEEHSKALRKAYSRRAIKLLEEPASAMAAINTVAIEPFVQGLLFSFDRAGLLVCADVAAGLSLLLKEESGPAALKADTTDVITQALGQRPDLRELMGFALSDDFFRLRQRVGVSLG
ncbi:MAG: tetratricopeptide repeat protein [Myxococcales bacterium]|nr:tetratricopeptide repeat protein [Myxococcales bacterium]